MGEGEHSSHGHFIFINVFPSAICLIIIYLSLQLNGLLHERFDILIAGYNETENRQIIDEIQQEVSKPKLSLFGCAACPNKTCDPAPVSIFT